MSTTWVSAASDVFQKSCNILAQLSKNLKIPLKLFLEHCTKYMPLKGLHTKEGHSVYIFLEVRGLLFVLQRKLMT